MIPHRSRLGRANVYVDGAIGNPEVCADAEALLAEVPGVRAAIVNILTGFAFVEFDAQRTDHLRILDRLIDAGYLDTGVPGAAAGPRQPPMSVEAILRACIDDAGW